MSAFESLPEPVRRHAARSLGETPAPRQVRVAQRGEMWLRPGARALRFTAVELFSVERVAFSWRARFPLLGPLGLRVSDGYADEEGELEVRLLGVPLQRERGPETAAGEALRYLAELAWAPHALVRNRELERRSLDGDRIEVATRVRGERLAVELEVDRAGDIVGATSQQRRRKVGAEWLATPWGGGFGDHRELGGVRVPTRAEAYWELPEGRSVYWRGEVVSLELVPRATGRARGSRARAP